MKHTRSTAALLAATTGLAVSVLTGGPAAAMQLLPASPAPAAQSQPATDLDDGGVAPAEGDESAVVADVPGDDSAGTAEPADPADLIPPPEDSCGLRNCIVDLAKWELGNEDHNRERGRDNCNFYSGAWRTSGDDICNTYDGTRWRSNNWCSDFARWVWKHSAANVRGLDPWAGSFYRANKTNGHYHSKASGYRPVKGDAVLYDWDGESPSLGNNGWDIDHVGIFEKRKDGKIVVIEGNTNGGASRDGVFRKKRSTARVVGYVSPRDA